MSFRPVTLLTAFFLAGILSACGTDTKTTSAELGFTHDASIVAAASATGCDSCHTNAPHYGGAFNFPYSPGNRAQYMGYSEEIGTTPATFTYEVTCSSCHANDDLAANLSLMNDYATSGHGDVTAVAWNFFGSASAFSDSRNISVDCQRCHTTIGFVNSLTSPAITFTTEQQDKYKTSMQVLVCTACHDTDLTNGSVRTLTRYTPPYANATQLPAAGSSEICIRCHVGSGNMYTLIGAASAIDPTAAPASTSASAASGPHYKNAAATIFKDQTKVGYEFFPRPGSLTDPAYKYKNPSYYAHSTPGCINCHMVTENSHKLEIVTKDAADEIIAINSQVVCNTCHVAYPIDAAMLAEEKAGYEEALEILAEKLTGKGYQVLGGYPYFQFIAPVTTWANQGDLGAAYNYSYLHHEEGAYAHNSYYAKRLIFDSIDWLDNNSLDGNITIGVAYPEARHWLNANAETGAANRPVTF